MAQTTPESWNEVVLGDCATLIRDSVDPSTTPDSLYIGLEHIGKGTLSLISEGRAEDVQSSKTRFQRGDILFGKLRPYFHKVLRAPSDGICSTDIWVVRATPKIEQSFLYYCMASQAFVDFVTSACEGTRMPRAKWDHACEYELRIPGLALQRSIASILESLDSQIELNRRMSETLEETAKTLFKSWFIDFDPVRAKMEGRQPPLPARIADLFPDRLVDSELGPIPEGWTVVPAGEAMAVYGGSTPSTKEPSYWDGEHSFATPKDMSRLTGPVLFETTRQLTDAGVARINSGILPSGTVLLSSRAPIGYFAVTEMPVAINQGIIAMVCDRTIGTYYALNWIRSNMRTIEKYASGTTFAEIAKSSFRKIPFLVPSEFIHAAWQQLVTPIYSLIISNTHKSRNLTMLRDTLLPILISANQQVEMP